METSTCPCSSKATKPEITDAVVESTKNEKFQEDLDTTAEILIEGEQEAEEQQQLASTIEAPRACHKKANNQPTEQETERQLTQNEPAEQKQPEESRPTAKASSCCFKKKANTKPPEVEGSQRNEAEGLETQLQKQPPSPATAQAKPPSSCCSKKKPASPQTQADSEDATSESCCKTMILKSGPVVKESSNTYTFVPLPTSTKKHLKIKDTDFTKISKMKSLKHSLNLLASDPSRSAYLISSSLGAISLIRNNQEVYKSPRKGFYLDGKNKSAVKVKDVVYGLNNFFMLSADGYIYQKNLTGLKPKPWLRGVELTKSNTGKIMSYCEEIRSLVVVTIGHHLTFLRARTKKVLFTSEEQLEYSKIREFKLRRVNRVDRADCGGCPKMRRRKEKREKLVCFSVNDRGILLAYDVLARRTLDRTRVEMKSENMDSEVVSSLAVSPCGSYLCAVSFSHRFKYSIGLYLMKFDLKSFEFGEKLLARKALAGGFGRFREHKKQLDQIQLLTYLGSFGKIGDDPKRLIFGGFGRKEGSLSVFSFKKVNGRPKEGGDAGEVVNDEERSLKADVVRLRVGEVMSVVSEATEAQGDLQSAKLTILGRLGRLYQVKFVDDFVDNLTD